MFKTFCAALAVFWVFDVTNMPFMEMFDTTYPINSLAWFVVFFIVAIINETVEKPIVIGKENEETDINHEE